MTTSLVIRDQSMCGETLREFTVELPSEKTTVRELIRSRVYQEVKESNVKAVSTQPEPVVTVQPTDMELALNGSRFEPPTPADWKTQFEKALDAFTSNQIMVFVDDRQAHSLDEIVEINSATKISFLRLTMLMGG